MKILIAPDSFKGSVSAGDVAEILGKEFRRKGFSVVTQVLSDGGEGFVTACCREVKYIRSLEVTGPLGDKVTARYAVINDTAIIELASSSGIELVSAGRLDPLNATTFGLGEVIQEALKSDPVRMYIGLGGSATHDAGMGMLRALGVRFLKGDQEITLFSESEKITTIDLNNISQNVVNVDVICAADVSNPLTGPAGAAHVYSRQKGATDDQVGILEKNTLAFADISERLLKTDCRAIPGAGAAGGTGFALFAFLHARMIPGFDVVAELTGLEEKVAAADLVITGEGFYDEQSAFGKAPVRMCTLARNHAKKCIGIFGNMNVTDHPFDEVISLTALAGSAQASINDPAKYLRVAAAQVIEQFGHPAG